MACNSQAATCQTTCLIPGTAPIGAATTASNANQSTACQLNCHDPADKLPEYLRADLAFAIVQTARCAGSTQIGNGFADRVDRFFGGGTADRDGFRSTVKIKPADMSDARRNVHVGWVAGEPHAGEAVLHDVE